MGLYEFYPSLSVSVKVTSFQALGHPPSDCFPIDCLEVQAIASCLRPSDSFSIQSIALCRLYILEFHIIDCFTVHFISLFDDA